MPRGKAVSDDLRGVILNMGMAHDIPKITELTRVKRQTIEQIFQDYRNKGTVMREHISRRAAAASSSSEVCFMLSAASDVLYDQQVAHSHHSWPSLLSETPCYATRLVYWPVILFC
jgi:hypothetical protein